jgi:hypothetical protein
MPVDITPHYDVMVSMDDGDEFEAYVRAGVDLGKDGSCKGHSCIVSATVAVVHKQGLHQRTRYQDVSRILGDRRSESDAVC